MRKILSFDAETNGLWGQAFVIGALVYDEQGIETSRFVGRCPIEGEVNEWVRENVLPEVRNIPVTHEDYGALLEAFARFYLANKEGGAGVLTHINFPVETKILHDMRDRELYGEWDAPFPLLDVANNLEGAGADPTSVDSFVAEHGLEVGEFEGGTHNPLYDSAAAAAVYRHLVFSK